ncbi:facilitated trehalose transporter Tret1-like [Periplaneta americana]|uniref:facilitated trehalose transporter Tret1-like n=1 Tax=Periplaneta americana TaxID=6978 RepID=UPI0037E96FFA
MDNKGIEMKQSEGEVDKLQTNTGRRKKLPQYLAAIIMNIAPFTYGVSVAWSSSAVPKLQSKENQLGIEPITPEEGSWIGSLICLGAVSALPVYSYVLQQFGRKIAGYLVCIPFIVGWILTYFGSSVTTILIARFIIGLGSGGMLTVCPLYVAEIAEDSIRGELGSFLVLFINAGLLFSYIIGGLISYHAYALTTLVFPVLLLTTFTWLPETPVYHISKENPTGAAASLRWLRHAEDDVVREEIEMLTRTVRKTKATNESRVTARDLVSTKGTRRALVIGLALVVNQQLCGIFAIQIFAQMLFEESKSGLSPYMCTIVFGLLQLIGSFVCPPLMDRAGRKILMIISNVLMVICLVSIGSYFYVKHLDLDVNNIRWIPISGLSLFVLSFSVGMGPVPFVMISEIFPPNIRGMASWLCISVLWLLAFFVGKFFITISLMVGVHICFWIFASICLMGAIFDVVYIPETKNKSLEEVLQELNK